MDSFTVIGVQTPVADGVVSTGNKQLSYVVVSNSDIKVKYTVSAHELRNAIARKAIQNVRLHGTGMVFYKPNQRNESIRKYPVLSGVNSGYTKNLVVCWVDNNGKFILANPSVDYIKVEPSVISRLNAAGYLANFCADSTDKYSNIGEVLQDTISVTEENVDVFLEAWGESETASQAVTRFAEEQLEKTESTVALLEADETKATDEDNTSIENTILSPEEIDERLEAVEADRVTLNSLVFKKGETAEEATKKLGKAAENAQLCIDTYRKVRNTYRDVLSAGDVEEINNAVAARLGLAADLTLRPRAIILATPKIPDTTIGKIGEVQRGLDNAKKEFAEAREYMLKTAENVLSKRVDLVAEAAKLGYKEYTVEVNGKVFNASADDHKQLRDILKALEDMSDTELEAIAYKSEQSNKASESYNSDWSLSNEDFEELIVLRQFKSAKPGHSFSVPKRILDKAGYMTMKCLDQNNSPYITVVYASIKLQKDTTDMGFVLIKDHRESEDYEVQMITEYGSPKATDEQIVSFPKKWREAQGTNRYLTAWITPAIFA